MSHRLKAVYQRGAFRPLEPCNLPEASEVELTVEGPFVVHPEARQRKEQARILKTVVRRMQQNPIPADAPSLTREALHERG